MSNSFQYKLEAGGELITGSILLFFKGRWAYHWGQGLISRSLQYFEE